MSDEYWRNGIEQKKDVWMTPDRITDSIQNHVDVDLDPCAGLYTFIGAENWTIEVPEEDPPEGIDEVAVEDDRFERSFVDDGSRLRCGADSLDREWDTGGIAYVNPPFSLKEEFIEKSIEAVAQGNIDGAIVLTPDGTDIQSWWHDLIRNHATYTWFSYGRIRFVDPDTDEKTMQKPPFGTALHFIGPDDLWPDGLFRELNEHGEVMKQHDP